MIAFVCAVVLALLFAAAFYRLAVGPTLHDRAMAIYACLLIATLIAAALGVLDARPEWIDAALALTIADFVLGAAVMKAFRARSLQTALVKPGAQADGPRS